MIQHMFANAEPFPHLVIDNFMPADLLRAAAAEFDAVPATAWVRYDSADEHGKRTCHLLDAMGSACRQILAGLTHPTATKIAGWLTGLDDLQADATLYGGGLHVTEPGGWLGIHADNERHPASGLARRLNLIVYCTELGMGDEVMGSGDVEKSTPHLLIPLSPRLLTSAHLSPLELWDRACTRPVRSIEPLFNRAVLFETGPRDYHGHPQPVRSAAGVARKSIAVYYWSEPRRRARFVQRADEPFDALREAARVERSK
jgi:hypothetical protein